MLLCGLRRHSNQRIYTSVKRALTLVLEATSARASGLDGGLEAAHLLGMSVREVVERLLGDVEADTGGVDRDEIEALSIVGELPARAALGAVPPGDELGAADVRVRQRAEGSVALGEQPVRAVRACDSRDGLAGVVVRRVEGDLVSFSTGCRGCECCGGSEGSSDLALVTLTKVFDNGCLHAELNPVEGNEPDNVPNPNNTDPATRDTLDLCEAPVCVYGNDRRNELRNAERAHESIRRSLHEEESVRTRNEDKGLRDNSDLEVDNRVELRVGNIDLAWRVVEADTKLVLEERSLNNDDDKNNPRDTSVVDRCTT